jgi:hypothetical protein
MGAYKKLNKQDAYITTYTAHKTWAVTGSDFGIYGIQTFIATGSYSSSLVQLYYPKKIESTVLAHSFDYYNQTTLNSTQVRNYTQNPLVISIPTALYGVAVQPDQSFQVELNTTTYTVIGYWEVGYVGSSYVILDDGEGGLYLSGSNPKRYVGDIIYSHGIAVITDEVVSTSTITSIRFKSSHPIYTQNYHCKLRESEFNHTYNPTAISSSFKEGYYNGGELFTSSLKYTDGYLNSNITGSEFNPYITTIGLYNDANELVAVAKTGQPIPKSANTEMTVIIKIDI